MRPNPHTARRGFTLIELSIVLGIIAMIAGAGMSMANGSIKTADRISTQQRLSTIKQALDSYARANGFLPCPADRTFVTSNALFGIEARDAVTVTTCTASGTGVMHNGAGWFGAVPVRTLGLPDNYAADSWGNKFEYAVSDTLQSDPTSYSTGTGSIAVKYGTLTTSYNQSSTHTSLLFTAVTNNGGLARVTVASGAPATGTLVTMGGSVYIGTYTATNISATTFDLVGSTYTSNDSGNVDWQAPGAGAAYAVISHGPDGRGGYPVNGTAIPAGRLCNTSGAALSSPAPCTSSGTVTCIDIENCNDDAIFYDTTYNDGTQPATYFDDYIVWGSNDLQRVPVSTKIYAGCATTAGVCEPWCAVCTTNYPGGSGVMPPPNITSGAYLFKKVVTGDSATCNASCFWSGTTSNGFIKTP